MGRLIRFRFRRTVLVRHLVFFKHLRHLLSNHIPIVRDRDERDLLARLRLIVCLRRLRLFWLLSHIASIHLSREGKASYSNASSEDFSGKVLLQLVQVTK